MALVMFDLDDTLVDGDCSTRWIEHMVAMELVDGAQILAEEARLQEDYFRGELDMNDYMSMMLAPLIGMSQPRLDELVEEYIEQRIVAHIREDARQLLQQVLARGDQPLVISASPEFLVKPIARVMGVEHALGVKVELDEQDCLTGEVEGVMTYQEGKVIRLEEWLELHKVDMQGSAFYSDSHNDLPLLEKVEFPFAVTPDTQLQALATARGWPVLNW